MAEPPGWWAKWKVTNGNNTANENDAANLGQLKQFAAHARAEFEIRDGLEYRLPGGAGVKINSMVDNFGWNLAQLPGAIATQSSTYPDDITLDRAKAERAKDDNVDGDFNHGSVSSTNTNLNAWWQIDLGASYTIQGVEIWNRTDCCGELADNMYVLISDSDMRTRTLPQLLLDKQVWKSKIITPAPALVTGISVGRRMGQYVMVRLSSNVHLSLAEVRVRGIHPSRQPPLEDYSAVTLGNLKAVGKVFYDRLAQATLPDLPPWSGPADDSAIATLGQLMAVFNFDLMSVDPAHDTNANGIADWLERAKLGLILPPSSGDGTDTDGDGATDAEELAAGTDPKKKDNPKVRLSAFGFAAP